MDHLIAQELLLNTPVIPNWIFKEANILLLQNLHCDYRTSYRLF